MAKAKRVYHWKHGWIPLDAYARAQVAKKDDLKLTDAPPKPRTRKPKNWVPPKDNVPVWHAPSPEERTKAVKEELAKAKAEAAAAKRKRTAELTKEQKRAAINAMRKQRGEAPLPEPDGLTKAERDLVAARQKRLAEEKTTPLDPKTLKVTKNSAGVFHVQDANGKVLHRTTDPVRAMDWLTKNGVDPKDAKADVRTAQSAADYRAEAYRKLTTVDGVDFVTYKSAEMDPLGDQHGQPWAFDEAQRQVLADAYNEVKAEFPNMESIQVVGVQGKEGVLGVTAWDGRRISISKAAFSDKDRKIAADNFGRHGAIAGQFTDDPEAFARATMVHELGHALQMQKRTSKARGIDIATEKVTPAEVGLDTSAWDPEAQRETAPRWSVDTLNRQTVYGLQNEFEWFAEAFAEGWFNGDKATPEGKRVLAMLHDIYGTKAAA